jgi:nucleoside-diphosphate kinase
MVIERTLVLIKPDGVKKAIIGKIISRFEDAGLKISAIKMVWADESLARNHYFIDETWARGVFEKTKASYEKEGKQMPFANHMEIGKEVQRRNMQLLKECPVVAMVIEGPHAIELVRKMVGSTEPRQATPGTIRGDFALAESYILANGKNRAIRNLIHASDSKETSNREISLWFKPEEIHSYKTIHDFME